MRRFGIKSLWKEKHLKFFGPFSLLIRNDSLDYDLERVELQQIGKII